MRLPDPAYEESFEEERAMRFATCSDCKHYKPIPVAYGDKHCGFCVCEDGYVSGCRYSIKDLECSEFEWREY